MRVNTTSPGAGAIGVIYNATAAGEPAELLVRTPVTAVSAGLDGWLQLPLASPYPLPSGNYWLGWLLEEDQGCFVTVGNPDRWSANAWPTPSAAWGPAGVGKPIDMYASMLPLEQA